MTEDHLFPKALSTQTQRQVKEVLRSINFRGKHKPKTFLTQNGIKKSTLCNDCNNRILGSELDPALIELFKETNIQLRNVRFMRKPILQINNIKINRIARSVAGHFIAHDDTAQHRHQMIKSLRRYILDYNSNFPEEYRFHLWLYPFKEQAILNDFYHARFGNRDQILSISAYKSYPLAFAFSTPIDDPEYRINGIIDLTEHLTKDIDNTIFINLDSRIIVDANWPYSVHPNGMILTSTNSSFTTKPYKKIRPYPY